MIFNKEILLLIFLLLELDDESITSEDEAESSMQMEETVNGKDSKVDAEKQKADALKKQIGKFSTRLSNMKIYFMKYEKLSIHFQFTTFILYIFSFVLKFSK
jgi:hypothetical protein